ncbi:glycerol-3-phosphate ABC transporter permease [Subtercola boreus]|uniref:Glycerol-3-phosphate ABC transporter permease n=1 Tax=Subtercola boreus TaxID=120213 RepID=A0A3E0VDL5_9MICO|nr:glycerol-3-phosphate ABC transporter permease [Subtercola boreus]TQL55127.1 carbohydrate ABC transporter membrane protein 1 (CUT1 family) [Subtercola boreus]
MTSTATRPAAGETSGQAEAGPGERPGAVPPVTRNVPDPAERARARKVQSRRMQARNWLLFVLLAGPNIALLIAFTYKPLLQSFYYSTLQWNIGSQRAISVGFRNYTDWLTDSETPQVIGVTVIFTLATVGGGMVIGLGLALLLNKKLKLRGPARTIIVAPYVLSGVAVGLLWLFVFDPNFGIVAAVLGAIGLPSPAWYNDPQWALLMVIIVQLWKNVGYIALIYLAGLQAIQVDVLEAAALDGAGPVRTFRRIILPLLGPTSFFLSVTTLLSSLQSFDIIQAMTKGGPLEGTTTMMYEIYREGFVAGRAGYSSAVATILFLVLLIVTLVQLRFVERKVHYS